MKEVTVEMLWRYCQQQMLKGNSKKKIIVASDDEGNGGHVMYYGFTENVDDALMYPPISDEEKSDYVVLG